jgi:hypothetical protein
MTIPNPNCQHLHFCSEVDVNRLTELESGIVDHFVADIRLRCADCGLTFRFPGIQHGVHYEPRTSLDGTELRVSVEPASGVRKSLLDEIREADGRIKSARPDAGSEETK